jgi:hypothetical protein
MLAIQENLNEWPVAEYKFDGQQTVDDIEYLVNCWDAVANRRTTFVFITKIDSFKPEISHVKPLAKWAMANMDLLKAHCRGNAIVSDRAMAAQLLLNAFLILAPLPYPTKIFSTDEDARAWAKSRLANP